MIIHDLRCLKCGTIQENVHCVRRDDGAWPLCHLCGGERTWVPSRVNTDILGGPTFYNGLDREFSSKSDLRKHLKENGLQEAGDKVGGARNESHLRLGKTFSYGGQANRRTAAEGK